MPFSSLMTERLTLIKKDGTRVENIKASVQRTKIFVEGTKPVFETGDYIECTKSNGVTEAYEVIDPGFHEAFHGLAAHYQMDVRNVKRAAPTPHQVTFNVSGDNSRINQNSIDNSTNKVSHNSVFSQQISALRDAIQSSNLPAASLTPALETVDAVEAQFHSQKPSKHVVKALLDSLGPIANIASIAATILSLLK